MRRYPYDLSHYSMACGDIGRLQTLMVRPVVAGESYSINAMFVMRLAQLKRNLTLDAQVDLFCFYVPHRHIYGDAWIDFIRNRTATLPAGPTMNVEEYFAVRTEPLTEWPLWIVDGYNNIWNEYFRAPSDPTAVRASGFVENTERGKLYGALCGRMKKPWSTGIEDAPGPSDREVASATTLDIVDLNRVQEEYRSEVDRAFFADRYRDVLRHEFGGYANTDADERPTLVMRKTSTLSGYDVDGTDDATIGTFAGKAASICQLRVPRRYMPEHGAIWIMALVRFPTVHAREKNKLTHQANPAYIDIGGEANLVSAEPPIPIKVEDWFATGDATELGTNAFGQHYRYQPDFVHSRYDALPGFPFSVSLPTSADTARYHMDGEYNNAFFGSQLGQWNSTGRIKIHLLSGVPTPLSSLYAGAN